MPSLPAKGSRDWYGWAQGVQQQITAILTGKVDAEGARDAVAAMIRAGTGVAVTYDDANDSLSIAATGTGGSVSDATATVKGVVQLAGDLSGTAAAPTVPGLAGKANTSHTHTAAQLSDATTVGRSVLTAADAAAARSALSAVLGTGITEVRALTQAQYDALTTKPATTLFVIQG